jgi:transcriptional regulator with XRE-family HTH domain
VTPPTGGGRYLASLREAARIDLETAAARSGIAENRLAEIEIDQVGPRLTEIARLAGIYGRSVDEIADGWAEATRQSPREQGHERGRGAR